MPLRREERRRKKLVQSVLTVLLMLVYLAGVFVVYRATATRPHMLMYRLAIVTVVAAFAAMHIFVDIKKIYNFIFQHRFLLAAIAFVILVLAKINFSNIANWNAYVQPGEGSDFITPVFGKARSIRSDEWAVSTPRAFTYQYCAGEKYNSIIMGTLTPNQVTSHISLSLSALATPFYWGYLFLDAEHGLSFYWCGYLLVMLLASNEFFLIITDRKKLLSFSGATALTFSGFYLWWSGISSLTSGMAVVVLVWYFMHTEKRWCRALYGLGVMIFGASFICELYPAWQVVSGYIYLAFLIWALVTNFENIKRFKVWDWVIFGLVLAGVCTIVIAFLLGQREYTEAIMNTVYPGQRVDAGGNALVWQFLYPSNAKFVYDAQGLNTSEYSRAFSLYPLPMFMALFTMIKARKKDLLSIMLLCVAVFYTLYITTGLPMIIAKLTLMTYTMTGRVIPYIDVLQIILLIRSMSLMQDRKCFVPRLPAMLIAVVLSAGTMLICTYVFRTMTTAVDYITVPYGIAMGLLIFIFAWGFMANTKVVIRNGVIILFILYHLVTGVLVWPVQKGADAIYSKPLAHAISEIVEEDPDAKWIALDNWVISNFCAACGASTITSNNYMPNFTLWQSLFDEETYLSYNDIYNRYANMTANITEGETTLTLIQADLVQLDINPDDLKKIDVEYIVSYHELQNSTAYDCTFEELYNEAGMYIYRAVY